MDTRRILVPLDGSTMAEAALATAESLASRTTTKLILVRAAEAPENLADIVTARLDAMRAAETYLETVAAAVRARGFEDIDTVALYGPAPEVILEAVRTYDPGLIVMTTRGRSGLRRLILGSVAETVVRGTQTPVFVVRRADERGPAAQRGNASREMQPTHV